MNKLKAFLSRKLLVAVLSAILLGVNSQLANPLDPEAVRNIVTVIVSYLIWQLAVGYWLLAIGHNEGAPG